MRRTATVVAIVVISVLSMATALATPPTGEFKYQDYARVQVVGSAAVPITGGSILMSGLYSVAPGGESGWRRLPGTMVLAVTKGKLMIHASEGCAAKEYAAGQAAVVPAGVYRAHNPGSEPLEFFALFFDQTAGAPKPLAEGPTEAGPSNCSGIRAAGAPSGVSLNSPAAGAFVNSFYNSNATLDVKGGQDVFATHCSSRSESSASKRPSWNPRAKAASGAAGRATSWATWLATLRITSTAAGPANEGSTSVRPAESMALANQAASRDVPPPRRVESDGFLSSLVATHSSLPHSPRLRRRLAGAPGTYPPTVARPLLAGVSAAHHEELLERSLHGPG